MMASPVIQQMQTFRHASLIASCHLDSWFLEINSDVPVLYLSRDCLSCDMHTTVQAEIRRQMLWPAGGVCDVGHACLLCRQSSCTRNACGYIQCAHYMYMHVCVSVCVCVCVFEAEGWGGIITTFYLYTRIESPAVMASPVIQQMQTVRHTSHIASYSRHLDGCFLEINSDVPVLYLARYCLSCDMHTTVQAELWRQMPDVAGWRCL